MKTRIVFLALILLAGTSIGVAQPSAQFAKANQDYANGDFKAAIGNYEELVRAGQDTPNLFYNLANAYFRQKDFGRAILNYERALALEPHHPEAQANLRIARDEARALEQLPTRWEQSAGFASSNQYAVAGAIAFWVGVFGIVSFMFHRRRRTMALSILSILVLAVSVTAIWQLNQGREGRALAIVITANVDARLATADTANRVLTLPAGSEIRVLSHRGDWVYAALPNNLRGWLPASSAEQVRM